MARREGARGKRPAHRDLLDVVRKAARPVDAVDDLAEPSSQDEPVADGRLVERCLSELAAVREELAEVKQLLRQMVPSGGRTITTAELRQQVAFHLLPRYPKPNIIKVRPVVSVYCFALTGFLG
jgi:hypothetical protein